MGVGLVLGVEGHRSIKAPLMGVPEWEGGPSLLSHSWGRELQNIGFPGGRSFCFLKPQRKDLQVISSLEVLNHVSVHAWKGLLVLFFVFFFLFSATLSIEKLISFPTL